MERKYSMKIEIHLIAQLPGSIIYAIEMRNPGPIYENKFFQLYFCPKVANQAIVSFSSF
jgi:hypothetical protein